jgi:Ca-activated chloride channel homolog
MKLRSIPFVAVLIAALAALATVAAAQTSVPARKMRALSANVVMPQSRAWRIHPPHPPHHPPMVMPVRQRAPVQITAVDVLVQVKGQVATTIMDIALSNPNASRQEAELLVPVPDGAVVRGFTFQGAGAEPTAELLPRDEARRIYDSIVAQVRDPALLEFMGYNLVRSSVFPVEARGTQKVRLTYELLLKADGDRIDYMLPRSEALDYKAPWNITVQIASDRAISTVYSPTHKLDVTRPAAVGARPSANNVTAKLAKDAVREPGPFRVSWLLEGGDGVAASLFAYPDPKSGGGYFLLLAGLPATPPEKAKTIKREVTIVLDRSGSMRGEKLDQVREATLQVLAGLEPGETFNIIIYNGAVDAFGNAPIKVGKKSVAAATAFLNKMRASGGTNIHDALLEALRPKPTDGALPIVLFLTDGLPTMGNTSELAIRELAEKQNPHKRRVFTFGVGVDVNTPLLEGIARATRATTTFVLPKEDVEVKVAGVFKRLSGPVLAEPKLAAMYLGPQDEIIIPTSDVLPAELPDLFDGDQLVVLGRYTVSGPIEFQLTGNYLGATRKFKFKFDTTKLATTRNAFVPRLWASRRIGVLVEAIRALGAVPQQQQLRRPTAPDPRMKELVDEIVRLGTEFGILTEYTSFLAREGTDLGDLEYLRAEARVNFDSRNTARFGMDSMNQEWNGKFQRQQSILNGRNRIWNAKLEQVEVTTVQQANDRAFYNRNGRWVDSRLVQKEADLKNVQEVEFGTPEFRKLMERLISEGRQSSVSLRGDILLEVDGKAVLVKSISKD